MLASPNGRAEKDHGDDISLAGDGFDTVIKAKAAVDSDPKCTNKVSCADILALATRDVVALVHHLLSFISLSLLYKLTNTRRFWLNILPILYYYFLNINLGIESLIMLKAHNMVTTTIILSSPICEWLLFL